MSDLAPPARHSRRTVVGAGAALAGVGLLASGCGSATTASSASGPAASATPDAPPGPGTPVGPASEVPVGSAKIFEAQEVVVTQAQAGSFVGFSTTCPHQGCAVSTVSGASIKCPCHGSTFALDGSVIAGPAPRGLQRRDVTVNGDEITLA
jgi:Rieske Fe-S protein